MSRSPRVREWPSVTSGRNPDIERLDRLAHLLDEQFRVPGLGWRFGLDGLLGLIPGVGDAATMLLSLYLVHQAHRLGAPPALIGRMLANVALDTMVGGVPVLGDLFDFAWKANRRNLRLLHRYLEGRADTHGVH